MGHEFIVCRADFKYQVENGVQKYIYHRPAHGFGVEGHQPPYLALGDYTVLQKNMCFSEEPGLFDPENGCGFNWSDTVLTGVKSGYRMSREGVVLDKALKVNICTRSALDRPGFHVPRLSLKSRMRTRQFNQSQS